MKALKVIVDLEQPLLVTRVAAGEENSSISHDFIPGGVIRGAVIGQYIRAKLPSGKNPPKEKVRNIINPFLDGTLRFLNALPYEEGDRLQRVPLSWRAEKSESNDPTKINNLVCGEKDVLEPKRVKQPYCRVVVEKNRKGGEIVARFALFKPARYLNVHNASKERQVKKKDVSQVFRYDALAADQTFCTYIQSDDETLLKEIKELIHEKVLLLGGSRSAGYGKVRLHCEEPAQAEVPVFPKEKPNKVAVILNSDLILRTPSGAYANGLSEVLGQEADQEYKEVAVVGGFNRTWGLPLPQARAIKAGSVFVYENLSKELIAQLEALQETGIGERLAEGFGEILVNWEPISTLIKQEKTKTAENGCKPIVLSGDGRNLAERTVERMLRLELEQKLSLAIAALHIENPPEKNQLSRIRTAAMYAYNQRDLEFISKHINNLKFAKDQLERARVKNGDKQSRLMYWLRNGAGDKKQIWKDHFSEDLNFPEIGDVQAAETEKLIAEFTARLIDGLMQKTKNQTEAQGGEK